MDTKQLAELLFPALNYLEYEERYQKRTLPEQAKVTRFAPSPTGFVHIGSLYTAYLSYLMAKQSGGVFYLRIEDTDQNRLVEHGIEGIMKDLRSFGIKDQEGPITGGPYGPYIQSERVSIYKAYVKHLVELGYAYPSFASKEELETIRKKQEEKKERIGYYGIYATDRNLSLEQIKENLNQKKPYVIRLKAPGCFKHRLLLQDLVKKQISLPENDLDVVLLKEDGLPTYHLAHVIDDHLMQTTDVIRGEEWLPSYPLHAQLFSLFSFSIPRYAHIAPICKKENGNIRKLSKRKDPECAVSFYAEKGIPLEAVQLYFLNLYDANFETWYEQNQSFDYPIQYQTLSKSGALFDLEKLLSLSKEYLGTMDAKELYNRLKTYYETYDPSFLEIMIQDSNYTLSLLNIERHSLKPRKDLSMYQDFKKYYWYFYDSLFYQQNQYQLQEKEYQIQLLQTFLQEYEHHITSEETWMEYMKQLGISYGYAPSVSLYKKEKECYKGHIGDVCEHLRLALTGQLKTPNLYEILTVFSKEQIEMRIKHFCSFYEKRNATQSW